MLMQNFGATNEEHYGMLWYFLERSIAKSLTSEGNSVPEHFDHTREGDLFSKISTRKCVSSWAITLQKDGVSFLSFLSFVHSPL